MRTVKIVILRFYIDHELREQFCGDFQVLPGRKAVPFKNETELLGRMHQLVDEKAPALQVEEAQDVNAPHSPAIAPAAE